MECKKNFAGGLLIDCKDRDVRFDVYKFKVNHKTERETKGEKGRVRERERERERERQT
jgi:hypothetical protein